MTSKASVATAIAFALTTCSAIAQNGSVFADMTAKERYEGWKAAIDAAFFFKNNEYFSPHAEGYTLIGYQLRPTLSIVLGDEDQLSLTGGLQALVYGGLDKTHYVRAHFAALWQATPWLALQMGSLPGQASHPTHEAIQDPANQLTDKPELGLQLWLRTAAVNGAAWLNWRQFIFQRDTIPERFTAGLTLTLSPASETKVAFKMPFALIFNHIGGQISDYPQKMQSIANAAVAPTLALSGENWSFVKEIDFTLHALAFHAMTGTEVRPFADGGALCPEVALHARHLDANIQWYRARDFFAPHGNPLLSSLSNYDDTLYEKKRDVLILGASFVKNITLEYKTFGRFALDAKGYLDTRTSQFDYSYGVTLVLTPAITLW